MHEKKVPLGLSKLIWNNLNGKIFNRKDRVAAVHTSLFWWQGMLITRSIEALITKPFLKSGPTKMSSTHCVTMEQCYRHQGKANAPISGFTRERQTLVTNTAALTFEPWNRAWHGRGRSVATSMNWEYGDNQSEGTLSLNTYICMSISSGVGRGDPQETQELLLPTVSLLWPLHNCAALTFLSLMPK